MARAAAHPYALDSSVRVLSLSVTFLISIVSSAFAEAGSGYEEAQELLARRKWADAAIILKVVLRETPDYTPAAMDLARALTYTGRREEALSVLAQAANHEKGARRSMLVRRARVLSRLFLTNATFQSYQEGLLLVLARKYGQARERLERALEKEPDNVEILTRIGQCLVMESDFDSAAERLRLARKLSSEEPEVRLWLGRALHQRGELNQAVEELRAAFQELPASELAPVWLAEAQWTGGQRAAAIATLEQRVRAQPLQLLPLVTLARFRYMSGGTEGLWTARRELQVALSRHEKYGSQEHPKFEGELGLDLRNPAEMKNDISGLMEKIESKLGAER